MAMPQSPSVRHVTQPETGRGAGGDLAQAAKDAALRPLRAPQYLGQLAHLRQRHGALQLIHPKGGADEQLDRGLDELRQARSGIVGRWASDWGMPAGRKLPWSW